MKKLLALLLSLVMVLGMIPTAFAAESMLVTAIDVEGQLPRPLSQAGDQLAALNFTAPAEAKYTVTARWHDDNYDELAAGTTTVAGEAYTMSIVIEAKDGYELGNQDVGMAIRVAGLEFNAETSGDLLEKTGMEWIYYPAQDSDGNEARWIHEIRQRTSFKALIDEVEVLYQAPVVGGNPAAVSVPDDANYELYVEEIEDGVPGTGWYSEDETPLRSKDVFEAGKDYYLSLSVQPKAGYDFAKDAKVTVGGAPYDGYVESTGFWAKVRYSFKTKIDKAVITFAEPKLGEVLPKVELPADAAYEIYADESGWFDADTYEKVADGTKVEKGKGYFLSVVLLPKAGYAFDEETKLFVNGREDGENKYYYEDTGALCYHGSGYTFFEKITKLELTLSAEPEVGKDAPTVSVPKDANYTINAEETGWFNMATGEKVTGKLEDKKIYDLYVQLEAKEGCEFGEWREVTLWVNGADVTDGGDYYHDSWNQEAHVYRTVDFCTKIDKAELTYDAPQAGKAVPEVKIPDNANYKLEDAAWYDEYTNEEVTTFENGKSYYLGGVLVAESGYSFSDEAQLLINGEVKEPGEDYGLMGVAMHLWPRVSFKKQITAVDLPDVLPTTLKSGDDTAVKELDAPEGANYKLYLAWVDLATDDIAPDKAPASGIYAGMITAMPKEGYEFATDVTVTMGGKALTSLFKYNDGDQVLCGKIYVLGDAVKLIEKIEVTAETPVIGEKPGKITVAADAGYEIDEVEWAVSTKDDIDAVGSLEGTWAAGDYAWASVVVMAKEGYLISPEVEVWFNGTKVELDLSKNCAYDITMLGFAANCGQLTDKNLSDAAVEETVKDVTAAKDGDTVTVDMTGNLTGIEATVVPVEVLQAVKDKDVDVVLDAGNYSWTINGKDVTAANLKAIDLGVKVVEDVIPADTVKKVASAEQPTVQISLAHEGEFGFDALLKLPVGKEYAGKYANLYYHNAKGELEFVQSDEVDKDGYAVFKFTHASDYVIVLDKDHTPKSAPATGDSFPVALFMAVTLVSAAGIVVLSRKQKRA